MQQAPALEQSSAAATVVEAGFGAATAAALRKGFIEAGCYEEFREQRMEEGALRQAHQFIDDLAER